MPLPILTAVITLTCQLGTMPAFSYFNQHPPRITWARAPSPYRFPKRFIAQFFLRQVSLESRLESGRDRRRRPIEKR
ncbi:hypothetical protein F5Y12DRAFT_722391 [Xylaria sp. FL1777]|nr:hypothetical protein F5Y12DRAFT_722391 [Xylaria sp. FL1777]